MAYARIGSLKSVHDFAETLRAAGITLPLDPAALTAAEGSPLASPLNWGKLKIGNRWCIHPMEGWDGEPSGLPTPHTVRRWRNFGLSGAKFLWGGEAFAVRPDGRANPNQLCYRPENERGIAELLEAARSAHREAYGPSSLDDLVIGLQLTHSGRFCKPFAKDRFAPRIAYHHPVLDRRVGVAADDQTALLTDGEIREIIDAYVIAARMAQRLGFQFVDVKACHGYLGHEFLSAHTRPGPYGGDLAGRTRYLREIIGAIRSECPGLEIGVRLSLFDAPPFKPDPALSRGGKPGPGIPDVVPDWTIPPFGSSTANPLEIDLTESIELMRRLRDDHNVRMFNLTAGSPYYNPHIQRPAFYPPSDGYQPPEDPLIGCVRQIAAVRDVKRALPDLILVGTAYTYFQEYLPHVAQALVRDGWVDSIGIGRLVLSDWRFPAKVLNGESYIADKKICRTFSDCTTAPRNGIISGCYPLDDYYKDRPEADELKQAKTTLRQRLTATTPAGGPS
jgi:NADPH2 dehydrogenase